MSESLVLDIKTMFKVIPEVVAVYPERVFLIKILASGMKHEGPGLREIIQGRLAAEFCFPEPVGSFKIHPPVIIGADHDIIEIGKVFSE